MRSVLAKRQGSALMLVMWAIMLMSFAVMGVMEFISYGVDENVIAAQEFRALHLAESGITLGLHPQIKPGDPSLKQKIGSDSGFDVVLSSEGSRFPVNNLATASYREAVYRLFVYWKMSVEEANTAADSLADWVDTDENPRSQGAEVDYYKAQGYEDFPRQQGFSSVDEMILVRGMDAVERTKPDWRNYFSVNGDGIVDLSNATKDVLVAFCDVSESAAENLIRERNGPDGIAGTEDDKVLTVDQARQTLGLAGATYEALQNIITTQHLTRRVESIGQVGESKYKVIVIARRQTDGSLNYLARLEE